MTSNQLQYWRNIETERANRENEAVNRANAFTNRMNADTNWFNAQVNQQNADTNRFNARVNKYNADINAYNATINKQNADTRAREADIKEGELNLKQQQFYVTPGGIAQQRGGATYTTYQDQVLSQVAANTVDAWVQPVSKVVDTVTDTIDAIGRDRERKFRMVKDVAGFTSGK